MLYIFGLKVSVLSHQFFQHGKASLYRSSCELIIFRVVATPLFVWCVAFTGWYSPGFGSFVHAFGRCFQSDDVKVWKRRIANWKRRNLLCYNAAWVGIYQVHLSFAGMSYRHAFSSVLLTVFVWSPTAFFVLFLNISWVIWNSTHALIQIKIWPFFPCFPYTFQWH